MTSHDNLPYRAAADRAGIPLLMLNRLISITQLELCEDNSALNNYWKNMTNSHLICIGGFSDMFLNLICTLGLI